LHRLRDLTTTDTDIDYQYISAPNLNISRSAH